MSHLLKQKSKVGVIRKDRVKYEAFKFDKRPRTVEDVNAAENIIA